MGLGDAVANGQTAGILGGRRWGQEAGNAPCQSSLPRRGWQRLLILSKCPQSRTVMKSQRNQKSCRDSGPAARRGRARRCPVTVGSSPGAHIPCTSNQSPHSAPSPLSAFHTRGLCPPALIPRRVPDHQGGPYASPWEGSAPLLCSVLLPHAQVCPSSKGGVSGAKEVAGRVE